MAIDFSGSNQLYVYVLIYPNSGDDWSSTSPFAGYDLSGGEEALVLGNLQSSSFSDYVEVTARLKTIGQIDKSVDIFSDTKEISGKKVIDGIGGVAKTNDVHITIHNADDVVSASLLLGRRVYIVIGDGTTMYCPTNLPGGSNLQTLFKGKIYDADPSRYDLELVCRGMLSLWDKEVGVLVGSDNQNYKASIYPITYGDFSDENGYMPMVPSKDINDNPLLSVSQKKLLEIEDLFCYDEQQHQAYEASDENEITIDSDNSYVELVAIRDSAWIDAGISASDTLLYIWNPPIIAFDFTSAPSPALTEVTQLAAGSIYQIQGDATRVYEYVGSESGYYKFTTAGSDYLPTTISGTLANVSGSGPATISFSWHSSVVNPSIILEKDYDDTFKTVTSVKAKPLILRINDELIFVFSIYNRPEMTYKYGTSVFTVSRGYNGTTAASHLVTDDIYVQDSDLKAKRWLVKHRFYVSSFSGTRSVQYSSSWYEPTSLDYALYKSPFGYYTEIISDTPNRPYMSVVDVNFDKVSLSGDVVRAYIIGYARTKIYGSSIADAYSSISLNVGGLPLPLTALSFTDYSGDGSPYPIGTLGITRFGNPSLSELQRYQDFDGDKWRWLAWNREDSSGRREGVLNTPDYFVSPVMAGIVEYQDEKSFEIYNDPYEIADYGLSILTNYVNNYGDFRQANFTNINQLDSIRFYLSMYFNNNSSSGNVGCFFSIKALGLYIHFYVDPLQVQWWARGKAREYDPDGFSYYSGATSGLIENPVNIIEDIARREIGLTDSDIVDASEARSARDTWKAAFSEYVSPIGFKDLLEQISKQFGLVVHETPDGKLDVEAISIPTSTSGLTDIDDSDIQLNGNLADWSEEYVSTDQLLTQLIVEYQIRYPDNIMCQVLDSTGLGEFTERLDAAEVILDDTRKVTIQADRIREEETVKKLMDIVVDYSSSIVRVININCKLSVINTDLADWVTCSSTNIRGISGKVYLIVGHRLSLPIRGQNPGVMLKMLEFDVNTGEIIQEVPSGLGDGDSWQEVDTGVTDQYQESV